MTVVSLSLPVIEGSNSQNHSRVDRVLQQIGIVAFLLALTWLAHFSQSRNIGFYSDDQVFAVRQMSWTPAIFNDWIRHKVISYPEPQGRPLGFFLGILFPYLGNHMAGIEGMFLIGWWILTTNAVLFYYLLRRSFCQPLPMLGAIAFVLFPPDTTRPFLCHAHILQPSLTFLLIASHLYLNGSRWRRMLAYLLIAPCLVIYESALLPFLAIPLLERRRDRWWVRRFLIHIATLVLIVAFVGLTRKLGHEYRAEEANGSKFKVVFDIFAGSIIGPVIAFTACVWRGITAVAHLCLEPKDFLVWIAITAVFALLLWTERKRSSIPRGALQTDVRRATTFGLAAIFVSYLFAFTHFPPVRLEGQETSVHLAAAIGGSSLLAAGGGSIFLRVTRRSIAIASIAIYLGLIFIAGRAEQDGFIALWHERQQFWTQLLDVCPDLDDGTLIICDGELPQPTRFMPANCWSDSIVLEQVYQFPGTYLQNPQVSCFPAESTSRGWRTWLTRDAEGRVVWSKPPYGRTKGTLLVERNTILLHMDDRGHIVRAGGSVEIAGKPFRLKDPVLRQKPLFPLLPFYAVLTQMGR